MQKTVLVILHMTMMTTIVMLQRKGQLLELQVYQKMKDL